MKIFEYIRRKNDRYIKIFGKTFMAQTFDYITAERKQSFLGGIITTRKVTSRNGDFISKDIKIFGHSFTERTERDNILSYYVFGKCIYKVSKIKTFQKQKAIRSIDGKYDDIYILTANSGETYLLLTYLLDSFIKKNGSKNPLLIATQKYHTDLIKMICPEKPYIFAKKLGLHVQGSEFKTDKFRFFMLFEKPYYFKRVEIGIKNNPVGGSHYFTSMMKYLGLTKGDICFRKITISDKEERDMLAKVSETGLDFDNFVFLAPEAQSCKLYDENFWIALINTLQDRGYDVFVNLVKNNVNLDSARDFKTCNLSFEQAFALARRAKKIVSLRSGFSEILLQTNVETDVLYTKFINRNSFNDIDIYRVISGFGLAVLPFVDRAKIREFNMFEISPKKCLELITEGL